ncbi:MAG: porin family protein [Alphaproteobacteria bacterium]|nr:porin family protein [Alphaproteobacteria bacterium]MDP6832551.1 porin family protein [Alphaproteobacteria bacterium]
MVSGKTWIGMGACAALAVLIAATSANAGTKGGLYDMRAMINEGHPFASPSYSRAPTTMPPARVMRPIAPPSPTLRYTPPPKPVAQASATGSSSTPYRFFDDSIMEGWFDRLYISAGGGLGMQTDLDGSTSTTAGYTIEFDPGFAAQGAIGAHIGENFRLEGEVAYRMADYDQASAAGTTVTPSGDIKIATAMGNLYYDIHLESSFVPYIGAGIGVAQLKSTAATIGALTATEKDATELGFQIMLGAAYEFNQTWSAGVDARYIGTSDADVSATALTLNVRYSM